MINNSEDELHCFLLAIYQSVPPPIISEEKIILLNSYQRYFTLSIKHISINI